MSVFIFYICIFCAFALILLLAASVVEYFAARERRQEKQIDSELKRIAADQTRADALRCATMLECEKWAKK